MFADYAGKGMVHLICAICENNGIGNKGDLPWKLRKEMAFFTRMTSKTKEASCQNAVVMGRNTWESIPNKYKPLANRLNVVISKSTSDFPEGIQCYTSVTEALKRLQGDESLEAIWIIGGYNIYKEAIDKKLCDKLFLTKIKKRFECDTFFPEFPQSEYQIISHEDVAQEEQEENGIRYQYEVHERKGMS